MHETADITTRDTSLDRDDARDRLRAEFEATRGRMLRRLDALRRRVRLWLVAEGLSQWLLTVLGIAVVSLVIDYTLRLGIEARAACAAVFVAGIAFTAWRWLTGPVLLRLSPLDLAHAVTPRDDDVARKVATILELPDTLDDPRGPSPAMVRSAVRRCDAQLRTVDLTAGIEPTRPVLMVTWAGIALLLLMVLALVRPDVSGLWARRWFALSEQPWPQSTYLLVDAVRDGRIVVPRGEPFTLRVTTDDRSDRHPDIVNLAWTNERGDTERVTMTRFDERDFRYDFPPVAGDLRVIVRGNDDRVGPFTIRPVERPRVSSLRIVAKEHPSDAAPRTHNVAMGADIAFLPRTDVRLEFETDRPVARARLVRLTGGTPVVQRAWHDPQADAELFDAWTHNGAAQLQIELVGAEHGLASHPTPVAIGLKQDRAPRVNIRYAAVRQRITPQASVPIRVDAKDDYGLAEIGLLVRTESPAKLVDEDGTPAPPVDNTKRLTLFGPAEKTDRLERSEDTTLNVEALELLPGSLLYVQGSAVDASHLGAQTGDSRQLVFRVVTPEELFHEIKLRLQKHRTDFRQGLADAEIVAERIGFLKKSEDALIAARTHRLIQRQVWRIHNDLDAIVTEMKHNRLGSEEARRIMERNIIAPMARLHDDLMTDQRRDLEQLHQTFDTRSLPTIGERQVRIIASMNRILAQMRQWDSFVDILNQLNEVIDQATGIKSKAEVLTKEQVDSLFD